jgi:hypothetical protein
MAGAAGTDYTVLLFNSTDTLCFHNVASSANAGRKFSSAVYRDVGAWYHIVAVFDTDNLTANDRMILYVNGTRLTAYSPDENPNSGQVGQVNNNAIHTVSRNSTAAVQYIDGYLTEINFIDGQALTPSSFGFNSSDTGVWSPKQYTGTFGTNGFYLNFSDNSNTTAATLGKDYSGNGNNWTPNNFSVTAGAGNDSLVDSPTPYGTDTGVGGEVRGNYCTLNPLFAAGTLSNGNLQHRATAATWVNASSTLFLTSGKWYWEVTNIGGNFSMIGVATNAASTAQNYATATNTWTYFTDGTKYGNNATATAYGASYGNNDVIGVALDMDAGTLTFYKNGVSQGTAFNTGLSGLSVCPWVGSYTNNVGVDFNFGQRAFAYTAPSGFKALCTTNLPTPTIGATSTTQANDYFDINLWTGTGATNTITNSGSMQPDFVWIKSRTTANSHRLFDAVRGATKTLSSNDTAAEATESDSLTSFNSNGFTLGADTSGGGVNVSTRSYVGWQWNAGGSNATNTSGTITSTVRANTTSGFSVVTASASGTSPVTVGHGLGVAPSMVIGRVRNNTANWYVYHSSFSAQDYLVLNSTAAKATSSNIWDVAPTSTVFTIGNPQNGWNGGTAGSYNYVAYCFAPVAGYSAFGSYTGNGSADGPFVYTGFRPRFVLMKYTNTTSYWIIFDTARSTYNLVTAGLRPNDSAAENTNLFAIDVLSNGFKVRDGGGLNGSGDTTIYAAIAENPFKYSLAR